MASSAGFPKRQAVAREPGACLWKAGAEASRLPERFSAVLEISGKQYPGGCMDVELMLNALPQATICSPRRPLMITSPLVSIS